MGNSTSIKVLQARPLTTGDAGGLTADVIPEAMYQPTMVLEADWDNGINVSGTSLSASGDIWNVVFGPASSVPNIVFYPISLKFTLLCDSTAAFASLFDTDAGFSISAPYNRNFVWQTVTLDTPKLGYAGAAEFYWQSGSPIFASYPPPPEAADVGVTAQDAVGGIQLTIDTWDATAAAATSLYVDARWLGFPRNAIRSGGFYTPRLFSTPN